MASAYFVQAPSQAQLPQQPHPSQLAHHQQHPQQQMYYAPHRNSIDHLHSHHHHPYAPTYAHTANGNTGAQNSMLSPTLSTTSSSTAQSTTSASTATATNGTGSGNPPLKPKRRRADANQLRTLNATYDRTAFPSTEERAELARKLGMTPRQVQIWYVVFVYSVYALLLQKSSKPDHVRYYRFQNKRQSFRQTRSNNQHAVQTAQIGIVSGSALQSHAAQQQQQQSSSTSNSSHLPPISSSTYSSSYDNGLGASSGPGTFGSIQLASPPGNGANPNGSGSTGYYSASGTSTPSGGSGAERGEDDYTDGGRRYR